eukprot:TRINITY_DN522_c0_g1_i1.p1 TRINITY_DN522_c0_g1~~TRINITY_DN522_c0_g1_i1.p1  ORF type:complete len:142 (-),score=5.49 TRINITY_DN522_c0_g1_i1:433-858(-)
MAATAASASIAVTTLNPAGSESVRRISARSSPLKRLKRLNIAAGSNSNPSKISVWRRKGFVATATEPSKDRMSGVVEESIKKAEEACAGDEKSGECAAAWDEVEEVSAAASDLRNKDKSEDPLENFCKDNPETDECRTYDN